MGFQFKIPGFSRESVSSPELDDDVRAVLAFTASAVGKLNTHSQVKKLIPEQAINVSADSSGLNEISMETLAPVKALTNEVVAKVTGEVVYDGRQEADIQAARSGVDEAIASANQGTEYARNT